MELKQVYNLRVNLKAREWCKLPYPDHPKGCPMYGKKDTCPPQAPLINSFFDLSKPVFLLAVEFDLSAHIERMLQKHPDWSDRQARCVLYWQESVNKSLRGECDKFRWLNPQMITTICPEAMGVNVMETARHCGIPIETKPKKIVYKIALAGYPKDNEFLSLKTDY